MTTPALPSTFHIAFIGGGNMASAIIGGLRAGGLRPSQFTVVEPFADTRAALLAQHGVTADAEASDKLRAANVVVWAVKPQVFKDAAAPVAPHTRGALHLSVAAGIPSDSIARWLGTERIVRCMPNTPALVGRGMTGLFARTGINGASDADRATINAVLAATGELLWVAKEADLDAVTALSGSGPAYVFYFLEAMAAAGERMGLPRDQALTLATATFAGATALARQSSEPPSVLRERVTSKGGTTYAALTHLERQGVKTAFIDAMLAAQWRAQELAVEFGAG